jgi:catalase
MKDTLMGRTIAILAADGSDKDAINAIKTAAQHEGAAVKIITPKIGGIMPAHGSLLGSDGQLPGNPSVLFDAIAVVLSEQAAKVLCCESAAVDFVRDAYAHLKAIAADTGGMTLLKAANVTADAGVIKAADTAAFIAAARTRQWEREKGVRNLA